MQRQRTVLCSRRADQARQQPLPRVSVRLQWHGTMQSARLQSTRATPASDEPRVFAGFTQEEVAVEPRSQQQQGLPQDPESWLLHSETIEGIWCQTVLRQNSHVHPCNRDRDPPLIALFIHTPSTALAPSSLLLKLVTRRHLLLQSSLTRTPGA